MTKRKEINQEIQAYFTDHFYSSVRFNSMGGDSYNLRTLDVIEVINYIKGGKAFSTNGIPNTFLSNKTLKKLL